MHTPAQPDAAPRAQVSPPRPPTPRRTRLARRAAQVWRSRAARAAAWAITKAITAGATIALALIVLADYAPSVHLSAAATLHAASGVFAIGAVWSVVRCLWAPAVTAGARAEIWVWLVGAAVLEAGAAVLSPHTPAPGVDGISGRILLAVVGTATLLVWWPAPGKRRPEARR